MSLFCKCQVQEESRGGCNRLFRGVFSIGGQLRHKRSRLVVDYIEVESVFLLSFQDSQSDVGLFVLAL